MSVPHKAGVAGVFDGLLRGYARMMFEQERVNFFGLMPGGNAGPTGVGGFLQNLVFLTRLSIELMAGYFSNHSGSRFLANYSANNREQNIPANPQRPRLPTSKHFSTSVATNTPDARTQAKDKADNNGSPSSESANTIVHPLRHTYVRATVLERSASRD